MKSYFAVEKHYLKQTYKGVESYAMTDEVSKHETLESALETLRNEKTSILSWQELNAFLDGKKTVLTVAQVFVDDNNESDDYIPCNYYVVL